MRNSLKNIFFLLLTFISLLNRAQPKYDEREAEFKRLLTELKARYDEVIDKDWLKDELHNTVFLVKKNNLWGACVGSAEIISPQYSGIQLAPDPATNLKGNFLFVIKKQDKFGLGYILFNSTYAYKEILSPIYNNVNANANHTGYIKSAPVPNFIFNVQSGNKWGIYLQYFKKKATLEEMACDALVESKYEEIFNNFYHGYALVKIDNKWGMIDLDGKEILPPVYDRITETNSSCIEMMGLKRFNKWGIFDLKSKEVISLPVYDSIACEELNYMKVWKEGKPSVFNRLSKMEVMQSGKVTKVDNNILIEEEGGKLMMYSNGGRKISDVPYDRSEYFNFRFIKVFRNGKAGLVDKSFGKEFLPPVYDYIEHYYQIKSSVYWLKENGKWGFADSTGKIVVKPQYNEKIFGCLIDEAGRDNTIVVENNKWGIINAYGEKICPLNYDLISKTGANRPVANIKLEKKQGIIDLVTGKVIIPILYDEVKFGVFKKNMIYPYPIDYYTAKLNGKIIYLSPTGTEIPEPTE